MPNAKLASAPSHLVKLSLAALLAVSLCLVPCIASAAPDAGLTAQAQSTETQQMYRLYNPNSGEHFYTADAGERDSLSNIGWDYEGIEWTAPLWSNTPVYRLYSGTDHHYCTSWDECWGLVGAGWVLEGTGWYSDDNKGVPLWRQYNPNVDPSAPTNNSGSHNYTTSENEHNFLCGIGWIGEDVGWYGVKTDAALTARYSYELEVLNPQGLYTGSDIVLYVKTDNPERNFSIACDDASITRTSGIYYEDVRTKDTGNFVYQLQPLASGNGYLATVEVEDPGSCSLYVEEYGKNADGSDNFFLTNRGSEDLMVDVKDGGAAIDAWMNQMIAKYCSEPGMTQLEKMTALCIAFEGGTYARGSYDFRQKYPNAQCIKDAPLFKYTPNKEDGGYVYLVSNEAPCFVTYCWNSYESPAYLYKFAKKLGFTDVENLYGKYPLGSEGWRQFHSYIQITENGQEYLFGACPAKYTNYVSTINYLDI